MTEDTTLKSALEALTARTKAGRLRELMPTIEAKVAAGVRHEEILEALKSHGFDLSERTYKTYLYRFRRAVKSGKAKPYPAPPSQPLARQATMEAVEAATPAQQTPTTVTTVADALDPAKREQRAKNYISGTHSSLQIGRKSK